MPTSNKRQSFEAGHRRKYLVIVDETAEAEPALYFCASRIAHSSGSIVMLYCIEPQEYQHWAGVRQVQIEEETNKAKALFRLCRRKLSAGEFDHVAVGRFEEHVFYRAEALHWSGGLAARHLCAGERRVDVCP